MKENLTPDLLLQMALMSVAVVSFLGLAYAMNDLPVGTA